MRDSVNLLRVMETLGIKSRAARMLLAHGKVKLDGRVLGVGEERLPAAECQGRMLDAGGRQTRLLGGRLCPTDSEQLQLR